LTSVFKGFITICFLVLSRYFTAQTPATLPGFMLSGDTILHPKTASGIKSGITW
jgi:hypothetical protein